MAAVAGADTRRGVRGLFDGLLDNLRADGYRGYEFDDFLASPVLGRVGRRSLLAARVLIQVGERLPVNVRPVVGVPRTTSTKAMGFAAKGLLRAHAGTGDEDYLAEAKRLLDWLLVNHSHGHSGLAWGNAFDFASRGGYFPKGVPTVVWTAHVAEAFLWAFDRTGDERYREAVVSAGTFVLRDLERETFDDRICIAYAPGRPILVHNSNLFAAVSLLRAWRFTEDDEYLDVARRAFRWSLDAVRKDGSIRYGVGEKWGWIDNFHTAYVLDCLLEGNETLGHDLVPEDLLDRALHYWTTTFFLEGGAPKYYSDKTYPFDIQCASQAIQTLCRFADRAPALLAGATDVLTWTVNNMLRSDGYFIYRRNRVTKNRLASLHWGQATMLDALGAMLEKTGGRAA